MKEKGAPLVVKCLLLSALLLYNRLAKSYTTLYSDNQMLTLCNDYKQDSMLFIQQELFICIKNASLLQSAVYRITLKLHDNMAS